MEFSPKPNKSKIYCSVYGCKSRACKNDTVRFFNYPKKNESGLLLKINSVKMKKLIVLMHG